MFVDVVYFVFRAGGLMIYISLLIPCCIIMSRRVGRVNLRRIMSNMEREAVHVSTITVGRWKTSNDILLPMSQLKHVYREA